MSEIDVVIPWVDGNDPKHKAKREMCQGGDSSSTLASAVDDIRFVQSNEIYYCIRSILKFMPWIRNIFLVTDNQQPDFLNENKDFYKKVKVVDHKEMFAGYEDFLPTFNSRTIASGFWKIPNISDHFLVLCDDFVFLDYVSKAVFINDHKPLVFGKYQKNKFYRNFPILRKIISNYRYKRYGIITSDRIDVTQKTAMQLGFKKRFVFLNHSPMLFSKESFQTFFSNDDEFKKQIRYRFRSSEQYLPEAINSHYLLKQSKAIVKSSDEFLYELYEHHFDNPNFSLDEVFDSGRLFLCAQSIETYPQEGQKKLFNRLDKLLGLE